MRAINIFFFLSLILLQGCTTIEVAKEVTKATNSVKKSIDNIVSKEKSSSQEVKIEKTENNEIEEEREKIKSEKKKERIAKINQTKITTLNLDLKIFDQIKRILGQPSLIRVDGNTKTIRFDTMNCRLFVYFNTNDKVMKSQYYEIRNINGNLIENKEKIKKCYQELKKVT